MHCYRLPLFVFAIMFPVLSGNAFAQRAEASRSTGLTEATNLATLVLRHGVIATADPDIGVVSAIAIRGHYITAVGSDADINPFIGPATEVIDLKGRFAMPGFIEGHGHFLALGQAQQILALGDVSSWDQIVTRVARAADLANPGDWILGTGWHQEKWSQLPADAVQGVPTNRALNAVAPNNPVLLNHASGHAALVNAAALAVAKVETGTMDPAGGTIVRNNQGQATGLLREKAQLLVRKAWLDAERQQPVALQQQRLQEQVRLAGAVALRHGVTSFHDAGADFATIDQFKLLEARGQLPVRLYVMVRGESNATLAARLGDYYMPAEGNDFLTVRSIKRQIDGALGAHGAWLLEPYVDLTDSTGLLLEPIKDIEATAALAIEHGFQLNTHAIGDRANREVLDLYERAWARARSRDQTQHKAKTKTQGHKLRWRIEHSQHIDPMDVPRFGELGVIAAIQGIHCTSDGPWLATRLGTARTQRTSYPWRDLINGGAMLGNGTDVPVEPINPIQSFYASVTRRLPSGETFTPGQALTRQEALASYTINNAAAAFEDHLKGSLVPGKLADITVLTQNLLTVPETTLAHTQVVMTFVSGELKYAASTP